MLKGTRIRLPQWIEGHTPSKGGHPGVPFVVRIDVEAVIPDADPSEPCFEPQAVRLLDEAQRLAEAGDLQALAQLGDIYMRRSA